MVATGSILQDKVNTTIAKVGENVTLYRFGKTGADTFGYATYDDNYTTVNNVTMVIKPVKGTNQLEEEGTYQLTQYMGLLKSDQAIGKKDKVVRGDGNTYEVIEYREQWAFNTLIAKTVIMQNTLPQRGTG